MYSHFQDGAMSNCICRLSARPLSINFRLGWRTALLLMSGDCATPSRLVLHQVWAAIGGDSMGGNFSAIIAQEMMRQQKPAPELQLLIYPATEIEGDYPSRTLHGETFSLSTDLMNWFMDQYLPEEVDRGDLRISPSRQTDLTGLPPAIVVTAGFDPLVDEGDEYAKRLADAGVDVIHKRYDRLAHGFTAFTGFFQSCSCGLSRNRTDGERYV